MPRIEHIQKTQSALIKRARLSLTFLKPFYCSSSLFHPACGDRHCLISWERVQRRHSAPLAIPTGIPLFLTLHIVS